MSTAGGGAATTSGISAAGASATTVGCSTTGTGFLIGPGDLVGVLVKEIGLLADEVVVDAKGFFAFKGDAVFLWLVVVLLVDLTVNLLGVGWLARNVEGFGGQTAGLVALFNPESMRDVAGSFFNADGLCLGENFGF